MQPSYLQRVFLNATAPAVLASIIWQVQPLPSQANVPTSQTSAPTTQISQTSRWNSVLHVARLVEQDQRSTNLVLQLEVLNKPQTTYVNAVYQVFARVHGNSKWQEIHTNRGARLMPSASGRFILESEVISIADLETEIRAELGEDLRIEDVELDCVVSIRYDLVGGGRDLRERFTYSERYSEIMTTTTTEVIVASTSNTVTTNRTSSIETVSSHRNRHTRHRTENDWDDDDDRDDDEWDDDDWDDDDDERDDDDDERDDDGRRSHRRNRSRNRSRNRIETGSRRTSSRRQTQTRLWESVLHVARQTSSNRQSRNLVLQLEILNKPQTTYANAVYQVFARTRGGRWQVIYINRGARLIEATGGKYVLAAEVIPLTALERELRAKLGNHIRLEDVEINCVTSIRYDLARGGRDIEETFFYQGSYNRIVTTTTTEITQIVGSSITVTDNSWEDPRAFHSDDDEWDDDEWDDDDDEWDDDDD